MPLRCLSIVPLLCFVVACKAQSPTISSGSTPVASVDAVVLSLKPEATDVKVDDYVVIDLTIKNGSNVGLWINKRMALHNPTAPPFMRELWLDVMNERGGSVRYRCEGDVWPVSVDDYTVLQPGESIQTRHDLGCYDLSPGDYRLVAFYEDGNRDPPKPPTGVVSFRRMLVSSEVRLHVSKGQ
jgi:hypothetical protein